MNNPLYRCSLPLPFFVESSVPIFSPRMIYLPDHFKGNSLMNSYKPVARDLPCDIHLINLRTMVAVSEGKFSE